jgi:hypothetical protein
MVQVAVFVVDQYIFSVSQSKSKENSKDVSQASPNVGSGHLNTFALTTLSSHWLFVNCKSYIPLLNAQGFGSGWIFDTSMSRASFLEASSSQIIYQLNVNNLGATNVCEEYHQ